MGFGGLETVCEESLGVVLDEFETKQLEPILALISIGLLDPDKNVIETSELILSKIFSRDTLYSESVYSEAIDIAEKLASLGYVNTIRSNTERIKELKKQYNLK